MATPVIDSTQSILGYRAGEAFNFLASATNDPLYWTATSLPPGITLDAPAEKSLATPYGDYTTDVFTSTAHGLANGDKIFFNGLNGAFADVSGVKLNTMYYVRDVGTNTFKLSATLAGSYLDITGANLTAGTFRKCGVGLLTAAAGQTTVGNYVVGLVAVGTGTLTGGATPIAPSAQATFTIGIEASDGSVVSSGSTDAGIDINIDVASRDVTMAAASTTTSSDAASAPLFLLKEGDSALINIRLKKGGVALDPTLSSLKMAVKEIESEGVLFTAGGGTLASAGLTASNFFKTGAGSAAACFQLLCTASSDALAAALSNYEADAGTKFNALCEIEWQQTYTVPGSGGSTALVSSSKTFLVTIERDLIA